MSPSYRTVAGRIRGELPQIRLAAERAEESLAELRRTGVDRLIDAAALNLHAFYSGIEHAFVVVARDVDGSLPSVASWHRDLLAQMAAEITDVRPAMIDSALRVGLDRYCGFRHFVRHAYTLELDPARIEQLVDGLPAILEEIEKAFLGFARVLDGETDA